jgi:hypothetical protein
VSQMQWFRPGASRCTRSGSRPTRCRCRGNRDGRGTTPMTSRCLAMQQRRAVWVARLDQQALDNLPDVPRHRQHGSKFSAARRSWCRHNGSRVRQSVALVTLRMVTSGRRRVDHEVGISAAALGRGLRRIRLRALDARAGRSVSACRVQMRNATSLSRRTTLRHRCSTSPSRRRCHR